MNAPERGSADGRMSLAYIHNPRSYMADDDDSSSSSSSSSSESSSSLSYNGRTFTAQESSQSSSNPVMSATAAAAASAMAPAATSARALDGPNTISYKPVELPKLHSFDTTLEELSRERLSNAWKELEAATTMMMSEFAESSDPQHKFTKATANGPKNMYKNARPYDYNVPEGTYINCSIMEGGKRYLAQGPKGDTLQDFLNLARSIHATIVCLTDGASYWRSSRKDPVKLEGGFEYIGERDQTKTRDLPQVKSGTQQIDIRTLRILKDGNLVQPIRFIHCRGWHDGGTPQFSTIDKLRELIASETAIVHCTAGIGRTGTFYAIELTCEKIAAALRQGIPLDKISVNIPRIVLYTRSQRSECVNQEQFWFIVDYIKDHYNQLKTKGTSPDSASSGARSGQQPG